MDGLWGVHNRITDEFNAKIIYQHSYQPSGKAVMTSPVPSPSQSPSDKYNMIPLEAFHKSPL
jgi:hypothetical protein